MRSITKTLSLLLAGALIAGCADQETPATLTASEVTLTEDGMFHIRWSATGPVDIYMTHNANSAPAEAELISPADIDGEHQIARADDAGRTYFLLAESNGAVTEVASRLLPLEGGRNFRDLGGYETADGRRVAWGRLFRSGVMTGLTSNDYAFLRDIDIAVICDFRSTSERMTEPTDWQAGSVETLSWDYELDQSAFAEAFQGEMSAERSTQIMADFYRQMIYSHAPYYAQMFDRLAAGEVPLAFHCSAGKDRTGLAAALILSALGVDRATIVEDYSLSDDYVDYMAEMAQAEGEIDPSDPNYFWTQLPTEVIAPFMASLPVYIEAAFDQIETDHGDVATYLQTVLNVTPDELQQVRTHLLD